MARNPRVGTCRRLSPARKFMTDLVHFGQKVPSVRIARTMRLREVARARAQAEPRPSWAAIFLKAYAMVGVGRPFLRQAFMRWPWEHLYEHPFSVCTVMVERMYQGEQVVLAMKIRSPETAPLTQITRTIDRYQNGDVESLGTFRRALFNGILPLPLRRLRWWLMLNRSGYKRCKRVGTYALTGVGALGAEVDPIGPATSILAPGPVDAAGNVRVQVRFDHRVTDAANMARCLNEMEQFLQAEILEELLSLRGEPEAEMGVGPVVGAKPVVRGMPLVVGAG